MPFTTDAHKQFEKMTQTPVPRLICSLAGPTMVSMLISAAYNLADTYFVSQLGTSATGAVGVVFSLMAIIQAVGFMLGMGSGGVISRYLGEKRNPEATQAASTAFFTSIMVGFVITVSGLIFSDQLMRFLGATDTILPYAQSYAQYILYGAPIMGATFVMNNDLRAEGKAFFSMVGISIGCILNVILDPLMIFTFHLGIAGAAIATVIGQCVSFVILIFNYIRRKTIVGISFKHFSYKWSMHSEILKTGMPSFFRQGLASIATIALNVSARVYGDAAVAAMSIVGRAFFFLLAALLGFGQGFQPVAGYNYGAKCYSRLKQAFWFCVKVGFFGLLILCSLSFVFAPQIMMLFRRDDPQVIAIGTLAFRAQCAIMPLQTFVVISNMLFQSIGKPKQATWLAVLRQGLCFLPAILILPRFLGLLGVQISQPVADCFTFLIALFITLPFLRRLNGFIRSGESREADAGFVAEPLESTNTDREEP
ncbi:Multidrug export protein MepA [Caprobacter fermentans]|uniref:Multidrug export protein MepA n=1 Tax=Caproicibacter fermentans TaxID=2576756 RepID=A0A6N8HW12_9FIRM|nr:MATE family efflux transporter [Caproicibacter fermentans]MVB09785.1 Multidrug export protein MepA [Caproicibacter fermentans]OCN03186.1 MATE family efflux transporter [Clostridium sp. W14A]